MDPLLVDCKSCLGVEASITFLTDVLLTPHDLLLLLLCPSNLLQHLILFPSMLFQSTNCADSNLMRLLGLFEHSLQFTGCILEAVPPLPSINFQ